MIVMLSFGNATGTVHLKKIYGDNFTCRIWHSVKMDTELGYNSEKLKLISFSGNSHVTQNSL